MLLAFLAPLSIASADSSPDLNYMVAVPASQEQLKIHDQKAAAHRLRVTAGVMELLTSP